jgi:hypothetical protein
LALEYNLSTINILKIPFLFVKQIYIVENEFKIIITEGRWNAWSIAGKNTLGRLL